MKQLKLKQVILENKSRLLGEREMRSIVGGYGSVSNFGFRYFCSCRNGANPPFNSTWTDYYFGGDDIKEDLSRKCQNGEGTCHKIGY